ncbi:RNA-binding (RRM/RBD/RNP motifs) family protein, partial [Striga asiatica]
MGLESCNSKDYSFFLLTSVPFLKLRNNGLCIRRAENPLSPASVYSPVLGLVPHRAKGFGFLNYIDPCFSDKVEERLAQRSCLSERGCLELLDPLYKGSLFCSSGWAKDQFQGLRISKESTHGCMERRSFCQCFDEDDRHRYQRSYELTELILTSMVLDVESQSGGKRKVQ